MKNRKNMKSGVEGPCWHMERLLQEAASGRSKGLIRWYTFAHAARCGRCGRFLSSLTSMVRGLRAERNAETDQDALERLRMKLKP